MGFADLLDQVSKLLLWTNSPVQVDHVMQLCDMYRTGGRLRQVPVAPCDSDQLSRFVDGQSEPAEQLHLRKPRPPLQHAD